MKTKLTREQVLKEVLDWFQGDAETILSTDDVMLDAATVQARIEWVEEQLSLTDSQ